MLSQTCNNATAKAIAADGVTRSTPPNTPRKLRSGLLLPCPELAVLCFPLRWAGYGRQLQ